MHLWWEREDKFNSSSSRLQLCSTQRAEKGSQVVCEACTYVCTYKYLGSRVSKEVCKGDSMKISDIIEYRSDPTPLRSTINTCKYKQDRDSLFVVGYNLEWVEVKFQLINQLQPSNSEEVICTSHSALPHSPSSSPFHSC